MSEKVLPRRCPPFASVFSVVVLLSLTVSGCARLHAKAAAEPPALNVPAPPARAIDPLEAKAPAPPAPAPPTEEPARPAGRPAAPPAVPAVAARPAPVDPPKAGEPLQTTPASEEGEVERAIRATLTRATNDLSRIDYRRLNTNARTQYDTAKRFIQQADAAVQIKNLVFAKNLADKAAALAAQLAGK